MNCNKTFTQKLVVFYNSPPRIPMLSLPKLWIALIYIICPGNTLQSQEFTLDTLKDTYTFIDWKANRFIGAEASPSFKKLFKKFQQVADGKARNIHVFHIGGSHIQADIYPNRLRTYLQNMNEVSEGQRGFIFPFRVAKTNNPSNYKVATDSQWQGYRCSIKKDSIAWGLAGITAAFRDSTASINIQANYRGYDQQDYNFNRIRVFYDNWTDDYQIEFEDKNIIKAQKDNLKVHYREYQLTKTVKELQFCIKRTGDSLTSEFLLMGLELMNDQKGIEYTSIGVNGASFEYYNRCAFFDKQLQLYKPDLFIISIGTNDAYHPDFEPEKFEEYYRKLITTIQKANRDCAILLTVPNDSYYKRKVPNPRTRVMEKIILQLSREYKMAVWNFYKIMGGFNSSQQWYKNQLMPKDRIHFTQLGYRIKADLLLEAFTQAWEKEMRLPERSMLNTILNE
ncbi:GDSL-type esterase/lipase family protein [Aquimarina sp. ERC-38]|uniref:DUF459 domain-containing protein n=1 Tax=Aquimarina sp. ERC-38 TaxID=2949996 RepID=UPI002245F22F|nr:GDSL-type esterase/lipase family protein [Aquimarina sp. ERC-38]UZO82588.1 GDSL-type esterase/lipase family protein [Aquimarina sp. ERC-38]